MRGVALKISIQASDLFSGFLQNELPQLSLIVAPYILGLAFCSTHVAEMIGHRQIVIRLIRILRNVLAWLRVNKKPHLSRCGQTMRLLAGIYLAATGGGGGGGTAIELSLSFLATISMVR